MPEPSSMFGRRPSLFSGKKRKDSTTPSSPPAVPEVVPELSPNERRGSSVLSLPSGTNESSLHRSASGASHDSRSSLSRHKSRRPSVATLQRSPGRGHRVSRSISANAAAASQKFGSFSSAVSPQKSHESVTQQSPQSRSHEPVPLGAFEAPPKTPFSMLATPFGHGIKRQDTTTTFASKPSVSSESGNPALPPGHAGSLNPTVIYTSICETANKRIATLQYLRTAHDGNMYYFNTMYYTADNIAHLPSMLASKLGRRATNYLMLGTSIPPLLDMNASNALEYLRALYLVLAEFETHQNAEGSGASGRTGRMGQMFKQGMRGYRTGRRSSAATESMFMDPEGNSSSMALDAMPMPPVGSHTHHHQEFAYLQTPSLPFDPDFTVSFATLTDILIDTYDGLLQLIPGPEACSPMLSDAFVKADKIIRKIMVENVVKEFADATRKEARSEVAGLGKVVLSGLM